MTPSALTVSIASSSIDVTLPSLDNSYSPRQSEHILASRSKLASKSHFYHPYTSPQKHNLVVAPMHLRPISEILIQDALSGAWMCNGLPRSWKSKR